MALVIFKHGLISERERVAIETKVPRSNTRARQRDGSDYTEPANTR